jgi:hypothetical protein
MKFKLKPPTRGLSEPAYPHLDLSNLPPRPGPSRVQRRAVIETMFANDHYRQLATGHSLFHSGGRCPVQCAECGAALLTLTWGMSAAWFPAPEIPRGFTR